MQKFRDMMESRGDTAVFTFGRLNPPTIGHGKLIDAMAKQQSKNSGSKMHIFVSHSQDAKKNPLSYNKKVAYIRKMFPKYAKNVLTSKARTIFEVAVALHDKGYKAIVMVVGSDRVAEFEKLLNEYNGVESRHGYFGFDNIEVVSAGERDPDAEGATGMSASKMRAAAVEGDFESFKKGLPSTFKDDKKIYQDIRKEMGIREQRDMGSMDVYEEMRDEYLTGKIWNVGDTIEANGKVGEIVRKGTNYVSYVTEDGKVHKAWLHHIELKERDYRKEYDNYHSKPEQVERRSSRNKARRVMGDKTKKGMDVGHKDNNPLNNSPKNLRNEDPSKNRREPRLRENKFMLYHRNGEKSYHDSKGGKPPFSAGRWASWYIKVKGGWERYSKEVGRSNMGGYDDFIKEEVELDEMSWFMQAKAKIDQMSHPKAYEAMVKKFIGDMKTPSNKKKTPSSIAAKIAREYSVPSRGLIQYINKLVDKGVLPKELKAEYQVESFSDFVSKINEVKQVEELDEKGPGLWANIHKKRKEGRPMRKKGEKGAPTAAQMKRAKGEGIEEDIELNEWGEIEEESEYQGRKVTLNKPTAGDVKKSKVYVKNEKGTVVKVNFGDKNMTIKKNIPARRKSFRARHNCDNPGPKWKARYWSCKAW